MKPNYQHFRIDESLIDRISIWIDVQGRSVNALSEPVFDELLQIVDAEAHRVRHLPLVFRSAKRDSFVVGADLRRILSIKTDAEIQQFLLLGQTVLDCLERFDGISVAVVQGPCLGGGLELALACKFRLAVNVASTQFGMPEAKLGLMPGWGGTQRLIKAVGVSNGLNMLLTGNSVNAHTAQELHLVDAVLHEAKLEEELTSFLLSLTDSPINSVPRKTRRLDNTKAITEMSTLDLASFGTLTTAQAAIYQAVTLGITQSIDLGMRAERELFYPLLMSTEVQQNLQRFVNRSKPSC